MFFNVFKKISAGHNSEFMVVFSMYKKLSKGTRFDNCIKRTKILLNEHTTLVIKVIVFKFVRRCLIRREEEHKLIVEDTKL